MSTVRVSLGNDVGRLVRVSLRQVDQHRRLVASRALREKRWNEELRPDIGYSPSMRQRLHALHDAALLESAAYQPSPARYLLPEDAVRKVLGGG